MKAIRVLFLTIAIVALNAWPTTAQVAVPSPGIVFSDLLETIYLRDKGLFKPSSVFAYFLKPGKGSMTVLHDGSEIAKYSFRIDPYSGPKQELHGFDIISGKNDPLGLKLSKPGSYELRYQSEGKVFTTFQFSITSSNNNDPYASGGNLRINGPWNNFAFLRRTSKESHGKWEFRIYLRSEDGSYKQAKAQVVVTRNADKKVVAVGTNGFRLEDGWTRQVFTLKKPGKVNAKGEYYGNSDLLVTRDRFSNGSHTATLSINGKTYGQYGFEVKDGMIQLSGRQDRAKTEPQRFIEGGGIEFWMEKIN